MTKTTWTLATMLLTGAFALAGCAEETSTPDQDEAAPTPPESAADEKSKDREPPSADLAKVGPTPLIVQWGN